MQKGTPRSTYELIGLPKEFGVILLTFGLILFVSPYLSGLDFGIFKVPAFEQQMQNTLKAVGPIVFSVLILLFIPIWRERAPHKEVDVPSEGQVPEKARDAIRERRTGKVNLPETGKTVGTGWLRDVPDQMDFTREHDAIGRNIYLIGLRDGKASLPNSVDLRPWFPDVKNQGTLNTSAVHAIVAMVEYFENRAFGLLFDGSPLFVYKNARRLMNLGGDSGTSLRATLHAVKLLGIPTEEEWPYTTDNTEFDAEPPAVVHRMARNYQGLAYFRHDPMNMAPKVKVLRSVKECLSAGIPSALGFFGFASFGQSDVEGGIPYACRGEQPKWGQAVVAVGYDDGKTIRNARCNVQTKGALLIRNSWGKEWADQGYGWLPYEYVLRGQAIDIWSILLTKWVDTGKFRI